MGAEAIGVVASLLAIFAGVIALFFRLLGLSRELQRELIQVQKERIDRLETRTAEDRIKWAALEAEHRVRVASGKCA